MARPSGSENTQTRYGAKEYPQACPNCASPQSRVRKTRTNELKSGIATHRKRECKDCGVRWSSNEFQEHEQGDR